MENDIIKQEIEKRLNNDLWEKQMAKKIKTKLYIYKIKKNIKIAILFLILSLSWLSFVEYQTYKKQEQYEILTNLYYEYRYPQISQYVNYYEE
ncbi:MAG: hypothetical protein KatS3mg129_1232 [Leptospiraceae bacterium]|nr:MAG: hypothetical protein KatS3mg129_1232 [Leptospiraceae bacterium]